MDAILSWCLGAPPSSTCWALTSFHCPSIGHISYDTLSLTYTSSCSCTHARQTETYTDAIKTASLLFVTTSFPAFHLFSATTLQAQSQPHFLPPVPCVPLPPLTSPLVQFPLFSFLLLFHTSPSSVFLLTSSHFPLCCSSPHQSVSLRSDRDVELWWRLPECQHISIHQHTHMHTLNTQESGRERQQQSHIILLNFHAFILSKSVLQACSQKGKLLVDSQTPLSWHYNWEGVWRDKQTLKLLLVFQAPVYVIL